MQSRPISRCAGAQVVYLQCPVSSQQLATQEINHYVTALEQQESANTTAN